MVLAETPSTMVVIQADIFRKYLDSIITNGGPFTDPDSELGQGTISSLEAAKVLSVVPVPTLTPLAD